ncbi:MAG: RNA polymerase subunit sigma-24 [Flavobacteriales bacterium]|jgi:RNA polymerase sigma-70 factor (ECF subfamily)|nr:RNA polymerase sigma factor [Flavobacteriales bacterium]MBQ20115.1 RNA polymerase subunit sigma-24 [Flavobacteriales bacterium]
METISMNDFNNHKIKEETVIQRILDGEKELYEMLVRRNNQKLYRIIRGYLKNETEIEDVMQNSYIKAYTKLHQFNLQSQFSTWLIRIAINESLAELKKKGKILYLNSYRQSTDNNFILEFPDYKQLNPQEKMTQKEAKQLLENAIDQLELKYRTVYIMKEMEEMSLKEIASTLDISLANVKIRLHRAKDMLKEILYNLSNTKDIFEFGFSKCDRITENVMKKI